MSNSMDINTDNLDILKPIVKDVLTFSQAYPFKDLNIEELMSSWKEAKKEYISIFGGRPIIRSDKKIMIILSEDAKVRRFHALLELLEDEVEVQAQANNGVTFYDFMMANRDGLFSNTVVSPYPDIKIREGMKLLKCFKYFFPTFTMTRKAQDIASRFIQDNKITGYLYLSVHPLDFLLLSENNSNWRSCHSLDGDYRAGNLSYMLDTTTVVAYLADDRTEHLRMLPDNCYWADKKWRMLLHSNAFNNVVYFNRQYPFDSDELLNCVYTFVNKIAVSNNKPSLLPPQLIGFSTIEMKNKWGLLDLDYNYILGVDHSIYDTRDVINADDFLGYCDLIYSPNYSPIASINAGNQYLEITKDRQQQNLKFHKAYDIKIGAPVPCVYCGKQHISRTDSFLCDDCIALEDADDDYYLACEACGSRIYNKADMHVFRGEILCETCYSALNKEREGDT